MISAQKQKAAGIAAVLVLCFAVLFLVSCQRKDLGPSRIVLPEPRPVQDFELVNQEGSVVHSHDLHGKVSLVTFLYTACSDTCPYEALKLGRLYDLLGDRAAEVNLIAISTDPGRDTVEAIAQYTEDLRLEGKWQFLTGGQEVLEAVWKDFGVAVAHQSEEEIAETQRHMQELGISRQDAHEPLISPSYGLTEDELDLAAAVIASFGGGYEVSHTVPFWFVDKDGKRTVALGPASTPEQLHEELKAYL